MNTKKLTGTVGLLAALVFLTACQPAPSRETRRFGRQANGNATLSPSSANTTPVYVTNAGGDAAMSAAAAQMAAPSLNDQPQWQLGNVSATSGVRIWSESYIVRDGLGDGTSGWIDGSRSRLHIEVSDAKVGQTDQDGNVLTPYVLHIGYDQTGFEGVDGGVTNGTVNITYKQSGYGYVSLRGTLSGNTFAGQLSFSNTMSGGEQLLGTFTVGACNFFVCQ